MYIAKYIDCNLAVQHLHIGYELSWISRKNIPYIFIPRYIYIYIFSCISY